MVCLRLKSGMREGYQKAKRNKTTKNGLFLLFSFILPQKTANNSSKNPKIVMIITTTSEIQGAMIEQYLGIVTAEVIYGTNVFRDLFAGLRDLIGGRTGSYEKVFERGHADAIKELEQRAIKLCANAIVGVEGDTGTINVDEKGTLLLITATGTAAKIRQ